MMKRMSERYPQQREVRSTCANVFRRAANNIGSISRVSESRKGYWRGVGRIGSPNRSSPDNSKLDSVHFPPMNENCSFGFVDPKDVLCGCHILPAFVKGKRQADGFGISRCAKDGKDYNQYYVNRCVYCLLATSDFILFPQVLGQGPSHALPLGAGCWSLSCTSVSTHFRLCFQSD